ncbi:hypothetical protein [Novosphingobium sp. CF614]|uniref:hypothetical protein n=1 Tax=Novosphingobium sp. CF614 TaxID=1884364 RepID=UPI0015A6A5F7|nr:hypothetical protein [Novosphingobium sp. CF614]
MGSHGLLLARGLVRGHPQLCGFVLQDGQAHSHAIEANVGPSQILPCMIKFGLQRTHTPRGLLQQRPGIPQL